MMMTPVQAEVYHRPRFSRRRSTASTPITYSLRSATIIGAQSPRAGYLPTDQ